MNHRPTAATHPPLRVRRRADLRLSTEDGGRRVIVLDEERDRQFRLSAEAARLLELLDGTRSSAQIAELLGDRSVDAAAVDQAIAKLMDLGLVESTAPGAATNHPVHTRSSGGRHRLPRSAYPPPRWRTPDPNRRFRFRPPGTLELSFGNPGQVLAALRPVADALTGAAGRVAVGAVLVAAAVAVPLTWRDRVADVSQPAPVWVFAALFASSLVVTMAHELGHGLSLVRAGGKVRRLGMLLLYGSPAFYCDVSQAWRLAPRRRLWVALAGVRVNITVGAAAAVNAAMLPPGPFRQLLSGMTVFNLLLSLLNLCPFVKFDGYVGLAGLLDHPNLRTKAMAAARDLIGRVIYGGRRPVERPTERMAPGWVLYGFGCLLVTPAAVGWALLNYEPVLLGTLGTVGAVLLLGMLGYLLTIPLRALMRAMRTAIASGVPMWRRLLGSAALSAATWGLLAAVPVPVHPTTVYVTDAHGAVRVTDAHGAVLVVVPRGTDPSRIGDITLQRAGMLWHPRVASGHACGPARDVPVDPGAGSPILLGRTVAVPPVRRRAVPVCLTSGRAEASGYATLSTGHVSARRWLYLTFVKPAIDRL